MNLVLMLTYDLAKLSHDLAGGGGISLGTRVELGVA